MKRFGAVILLVLFLSGCSGAANEMNRSLMLREKLQNGSCAFTAKVTADYGDKAHVFSLQCQADEKGNIKQVTEDVVGPYELHDFFLYNFVHFGFSPEKILLLAEKAFSNYDHDTIVKWLKTFIHRFFSQQFKRSCLPDGPKVGSVTLSPRGDWRMPTLKRIFSKRCYHLCKQSSHLVGGGISCVNNVVAVIYIILRIIIVGFVRYD